MVPPPDRSLSARMMDAARDLEEQIDLPHTAEIAVQLAVSNVAGCDAAGISLVHSDRKIETLGATDPLVITADRLQYETREGPCLDAIWEQRTIHSPSLVDAERWPTWGPAVVEETGAQSVLAVHLFTDGETLGALNMYSRSRDGFDKDDREVGLALAAHIAIAFAASQKISNLTTAMDARSVIGQAMGIIMERFDMSPAQAFAVLARLSQTDEEKLGDIAAQLVATRNLPEPDGPG